MKEHNKEIMTNLIILGTGILIILMICTTCKIEYFISGLTNGDALYIYGPFSGLFLLTFGLGCFLIGAGLWGFLTTKVPYNNPNEIKFIKK